MSIEETEIVKQFCLDKLCRYTRGNITPLIVHQLYKQYRSDKGHNGKCLNKENLITSIRRCGALYIHEKIERNKVVLSMEINDDEYNFNGYMMRVKPPPNMKDLEKFTNEFHDSVKFMKRPITTDYAYERYECMVSHSTLPFDEDVVISYMTDNGYAITTTDGDDGEDVYEYIYKIGTENE
jgi:hypothetical protein